MKDIPSEELVEIIEKAFRDMPRKPKANNCLTREDKDAFLACREILNSKPKFSVEVDGENKWV